MESEHQPTNKTSLNVAQKKKDTVTLAGEISDDLKFVDRVVKSVEKSYISIKDTDVDDYDDLVNRESPIFVVLTRLVHEKTEKANVILDVNYGFKWYNNERIHEPSYKAMFMDTCCELIHKKDRCEVLTFNEKHPESKKAFPKVPTDEKKCMKELSICDPSDPSNTMGFMEFISVAKSYFEKVKENNKRESDKEVLREKALKSKQAPVTTQARPPLPVSPLTTPVNDNNKKRKSEALALSKQQHEASSDHKPPSDSHAEGTLNRSERHLIAEQVLDYVEQSYEKIKKLKPLVEDKNFMSKISKIEKYRHLVDDDEYMELVELAKEYRPLVLDPEFMKNVKMAEMFPTDDIEILKEVDWSVKSLLDSGDIAILRTFRKELQTPEFVEAVVFCVKHPHLLEKDGIARIKTVQKHPEILEKETCDRIDYLRENPQILDLAKFAFENQSVLASDTMLQAYKQFKCAETPTTDKV